MQFNMCVTSYMMSILLIFVLFQLVASYNTYVVHMWTDEKSLEEGFKESLDKEMRAKYVSFKNSKKLTDAK